MHNIQWFGLILVSLLASGCAAFQVAGEVQSGRRALVMNESETALGYFQQAADSNPNYIYRSVNFQEGIWTYVGRAQYGLGKWSEAKASFERALFIYKDDVMAQLYLGLAMIRGGDQAQGLKQLQQALKNLSGLIDYLNSSRPQYAYWDPSGAIRKEIDSTLALIGSEKVEPGKDLFASAEWVGLQMEEEIDRVRGDEQRQFNRDLQGDFRRGTGGGVGVGIGF